MAWFVKNYTSELKLVEFNASNWKRSWSQIALKSRATFYKFCPRALKKNHSETSYNLAFPFDDSPNVLGVFVVQTCMQLIPIEKMFCNRFLGFGYRMSKLNSYPSSQRNVLFFFFMMTSTSQSRELKHARFWEADGNRKRTFRVLGPYCLPDFYTTQL